MKKIIFILIISLFFSGCVTSIDDKSKNSNFNKNTEIKDTALIDNSESIDLKNKIACYNLRDNILKEIEKFNKENYHPDLYVYSEKELNEIFYSQKLNSCLYVELNGVVCGSSYLNCPTIKYHRLEYQIIDILNNKKIDSIDLIGYNNTMVDVENMIDKYR